MAASSSSVRVIMRLDSKEYEQVCDRVVKQFRDNGERQSIKSKRVRLKHVEMTAAKFEELATLQRVFPAFTLKRFKNMQARGILGKVCGCTIVLNDELEHTVKFVYHDVKANQEERGLTDPSYITGMSGSMAYFAGLR